VLNRYVFAGTVASVLFILSLIAGFSSSTGFFVGNLVPELIGVCIELLIILFVFDRWQKLDDQQKKIKVERRLREFLIFFLKHSFSSFPSSCQSERFYGSDHAKNQEALNNLIEHIKLNKLTSNEAKVIEEYCLKEKEIFNNLMSVSSELENDHFKSWVRISYFMNSIVNQGEEVNHAVINILENIKRFDNTSHENNLYVGADK
jgi:hypothetical protein